MRHIENTHAGDVHVADGYTAISGAVTGDVVVEDGRLTLTATGVIGGNVTVFGGTVQLIGIVGGDVVNEGGDVIVSGAVDGAVRGPEDRTIIAAEALPVAASVGADESPWAAPPAAAVAVGAVTQAAGGAATTLGEARYRQSPADGATSNVIGATRRRYQRLRNGLVSAGFVVLIVVVIVAILLG